MNPKRQKCCAQNCAKYHWIFHDAFEDWDRCELSAAKCFQSQHRQNIVHRDYYGNHHRRYGNVLVAENICDDWHAHYHEVATENRLNHDAAPSVVRLNLRDNQHQQRKNYQHTARAEEHEFWAKRRRHVRRVNAVKHHAKEKHAENHAVHVVEFFVRQPLLKFHERANRH